MQRIIQIEWLKVKYYRTFWILLGLAVAIIPASNFIVAEISTQIANKAKQIITVAPYDFPLVWQTVANVNTYTSAVFGLLLLTLVTNEFTYKTHRQNIIDGWERRDFVLAKLFWVVALSLLALVVAVVTATAYGFGYGTQNFSTEDGYYLGYYFLQVFLSLCLALLTGVLVKRAGLAIVLYLGYVMVLEQVLVTTIKRFVGPVGSLLPLQTADELIPFPVIGKLVGNDSRYDDTVYLAVLLAYIALALWCVFRKMTKADL